MFVVRASGRVTIDEGLAIIDQLRADSRLCCGVSLIVDGCNVDSAPSATDLRILAGELKPLFDQGLAAVAIFTDRTFVYGVARMFAAFAEAFGENVHVFRTEDEARGWIEEQTPHAA